MKQLLIKSIAVLTVVGWAVTANASVNIELIRVSDSVAEISGTGTMDVAGTGLVFENVASTGNIGLDDGMTGNFMIGSATVNTPIDPFILNGTNNMRMDFNSAWMIGDAPNGLGTITLDLETWNATGTAGNITASGTIVGTYSMVSAAPPEPVPTMSALSLGILTACIGLLGLLGYKRRMA